MSALTFNGVATPVALQGPTASEAPMTQLTIDNVSRHVGEHEILRQVTLHMRTGEFVTLVGPSGCGKSTLLRIIAGLEPGHSGRVEMNGKDMRAATPRQRNVAMVFQNYALYPHMSAFDNIATPLRMDRLALLERLGLPVAGSATIGKWRGIEDEVNRVLEALEIGHLRDRRPAALSGGQKQRVALGRAMIRQPSAFLMDEPLSNLDAQLRVHMRAEIVALHRALKATFIYVTHDQAEAMTMSDRIAVMRAGEILQFAAPGEIYNNPAHQYVAEFIGSPKINIIPCRVDRDGFAFLGSEKVGRTSKGAAGRSVKLALRPDALRLDGQATALVDGCCCLVENLGDSAFVHIKSSSCPERALIARASPDALPAPGSGLAVRLDLSRAFAFDETGRRLPWEAVR
jgi:multiple sugar transport system ATP-binding protein